VELHVHNLDACNWLMDDHPIKATGTSQFKKERKKEDGDIYSFFEVEFKYRNGVKLKSKCGDGKLAGVQMNAGEYATCRDGRCAPGSRRWPGVAGAVLPADANPYQQENADLVESIRTGKPINEAQALAVPGQYRFY
jgi:myo-inositol 2-dehydrogenase / D-chiro-inositol 1-dehydrogenase